MRTINDEINNAKYILARMGGGRGYNLEDTDLQEIEKSIQHGLQDGTLNKEWAEATLEKITKLRNSGPEPV